MLKTQNVLFLIFLLVVNKLNGYPSPRDTDGSSGPYEDVVEYVDETGKVVEGGVGGPPDGYEVINAEETDNGGADQSNDEAIDDINLNEFDQNGNYKGDPIIVDHTNDQVEQNERAVSSQDQDYYESGEQMDMGSFNKQNSGNQQTITNSKNNRNDKVFHQTSRIPQRDPYKVIEDKYPGIFEKVKNSNYNGKNIKWKDVSYDQDQLAPSKSINDSPVQQMDIHPAMVTDKTIFSENSNISESPEQQMDVNPGMNAQNKVVLQQMSGLEIGPEAVQITEQKSPNTNSTAGIDQEKFQDTIFKPKRESRVLARYKVIIPVIVPNLRFRVPDNKKH